MSVVPEDVINDDMFDPAVIADPYTHYGRLRELDPVHWNDLHKVWVVTRHDDVTWITLHPELFSSAVPQRDPLPPYPAIDEADRDEYEYVRANQAGRIVTTDRPDHRAMRNLLYRAFTPAAAERWRPMIRTAIEELLDKLPDPRRMDVLNDLAIPLPLSVISELLDIPENDRAHVREIAVNLLIGPRVAPGRMREVADSMRAMDEYINPIVEERIARPGSDLISAVCRGEIEGIYTRDQVLRNVAFLVVAGHETTINLIANALVAFCRNPDQWDLLHSDPDRLSVTATEEILRYDPPVISIERIVDSEVELRGRTLEPLQRVRWFIASANRDPERFVDPDRFDISRSPNPHVTFGHGIHLCLGASLARVEGQEVLRAFARRFSRFELLTQDLRYAPAAHLRSLKELEVSCVR